VVASVGRIIAPGGAFVTGLFLVTPRGRGAIKVAGRPPTEEGPMTARIHSAVLHRVAVPAWLLGFVLATAIAASVFAAVDTTADPVPADTSYHQLPTTCVDSSVVGHC
jgi:hypothetical protein